MKPSRKVKSVAYFLLAVVGPLGFVFVSRAFWQVDDRDPRRLLFLIGLIAAAVVTTKLHVSAATAAWKIWDEHK
jgi:hypothetical protein